MIEHPAIVETPDEERTPIPFPGGQRVPASSLPSPLTPLIGRETEMAAVAALLAQPEVRLVTLTGPGGTGKTRLALAAAAGVAGDYPDGAWFVDLAPLTDPALLAPAIAQVLGVRESPDEPLTARLVAFLERRRLLFVLDNVEQIVTAAPLIADLLRAAPEVTVLATSRVRLNLSGEHVYPVPPLALPDTSAGFSMDSPAVRLFMERAREVNPGFAAADDNAPVISAICRRLDGLPLAIDLAARWVTVLLPAALLAGLQQRLPLLTGGARDLPARQQTMRDAIAWSYALLTPDEQTRFRRLSVFTGGFTLEAATAVAGGQADRRTDGESLPSVRLSASPSFLDRIAALVDRSLVLAMADAQPEPRYRMLETIREFGLKQLAASGEEVAIRDAHAAFMIELAQRAEGWGPESDLAQERLAADLDNVRAALAWHQARGDVDGMQRLAGSLWEFWYMRGHVTEGRRWLAAADALGEGSDQRALASVLTGAGALAGLQGDVDEALAALADGAERYAALGDHLRHGIALGCQGNVRIAAGDLPGAQAMYEAELAAYQAAGDEFGIGAALINLARIAMARGNFDQAAIALDRATERYRDGGRWDQAIVISYRARLELARGNPHGALPRYQESLALFWELGDEAATARCLEALAGIAAMYGVAEPAARWLGTAAMLRDRAGRPPDWEERIPLEAAIATARKTLGQARFDAAFAGGQGRAAIDSVSEALAMVLPAVKPVDPARRGLTNRELDVLRLVADGRSDREIAAELSISYRTVTSYLTNIFTKLDVDSRTAAATYAVRRGLV